MKALVYHGPNKKSWDTRDKPGIQNPTDAIVRITKTTICGTDLHIMKGDVPEVTVGRILGHEGVGITPDPANQLIVEQDFHFFTIQGSKHVVIFYQI